MTIFRGVGAPGTVGPANGGKIYAYNAITNAGGQTVAPVNTSRTSITFFNPGTVDIYIGPVTVLDSNGSNTTLVLSLVTKGGSIIVFANGGSLTITGECQGAWQAIAASGTTNPLTVMDSNS